MESTKKLLEILCLSMLLGSAGFSETWPGEEPRENPRTEWIEHQIPGTFCGNGTPYKFFVHYAKYNNNLLFIFEPGGACWDHGGCSGKKGVRGAAHPEGIKDGFMTNLNVSINAIASPFTWRNHPWDAIEPGKWNKVFLPYCTGDIFAGDKVTLYKDPSGAEPDLTYHHVGRKNVQKVIEWTNDVFPKIGRFMVTGASAGGAGATINYHFLRQGLNIEEDAVLLNDSGPLFPSYSPETSHSFHIQQKIRRAWGVDDWAQNMDSEFRDKLKLNYLGEYDYGSIVEVLAMTYPNDRLGHAHFSRDYIYSLYLYEDFYGLDGNTDADKEMIHQLWLEDQQRLMWQFDQYQNLSYFIPYYRRLASSHCSTLADFEFTDINVAGVNYDLGNYIDRLLSYEGQPDSYVEGENPDDFNKSNWLHGLLDRLFRGQTVKNSKQPTTIEEFYGISADREGVLK